MSKIEDVLEALELLKAELMDKLNVIIEKNAIGTPCNHCGGDGLKAVQEGSIPCPNCNATGYKIFGIIKTANL